MVLYNKLNLCLVTRQVSIRHLYETSMSLSSTIDHTVTHTSTFLCLPSTEWCRNARWSFQSLLHRSVYTIHCPYHHSKNLLSYDQFIMRRGTSHRPCKQIIQILSAFYSSLIHNCTVCTLHMHKCRTDNTYNEKYLTSPTSWDQAVLPEAQCFYFFDR